MPIYVAVPLTSDSTSLDKAVEKHIPAVNRYQLPATRGWLIKFDGTTVELTNHIELTGQEQGVPAPVLSTIIMPITGYYGRGSADMWEWLKVRFEQSNG